MGKTGKGLAEYAVSKLGTPYFYGSKMTTLTENFMSQMHRSYPSVVTSSYMAKARAKGMVGKVCCDCSGLIGAYRQKQIGSAQLYATAKKRLPIANVKDFGIGTVLWKSGHVGVYIGMENGIPMCVEEKGINYGCVKTKVSATKWVYGLTFDDITYEYQTNLDGASKGTNPYVEPTGLVYYIKGQGNTVRNGVKWLQWELNEAGYALEIDGKFGDKTRKALIKYQMSTKYLEVDGICGPLTRKALKET